MKFIIYTIVSADSKEEALEKMTEKMDTANEEFQTDCGNPPDMEWAKKAGFHIKKKID
jgi:hypothetical protein